jgi:nitrite reductase/ring-hydroxylating ferredoxin subunit/multimeric flavodoxin WrbA
MKMRGVRNGGLLMTVTYRGILEQKEFQEDILALSHAPRPEILTILRLHTYDSKNKDKGEDDEGYKGAFRYVSQLSELSTSGKAQQFTITIEKGKKIELAVFNVDGRFYAISNTCRHEGGPLSQGTLDGKMVTCPWHGWKYSIIDGKAPHKGGDSVDSYETKVVNEKLYVNPIPSNLGKRVTQSHEAYTNLKNTVKTHLDHLDKNEQLLTGKNIQINVLGISTTNANDKIAPRISTSERALFHALDYAKGKLGTNTQMIKLRDLYFKHCEGYYSKNANACIFPCSISEMDKEDQMTEVYEKIIIWADVVVIATPIRWGNASSLYYQMIQRMNCVQNQMITKQIFLVRDKVAAFIITGGQDNVQHVAGELMAFWSQLGFVFGKFPFVGWSRGWYAEDTENNLTDMEKNNHMKQDIAKTILGAVELSKLVRQSRYDEAVLKAQS